MKVISAYDSELKNNPQYEIAWNNKGSALNNLIRFKEGLAAVETAFIIDSNDLFAWKNKWDFTVWP